MNAMPPPPSSPAPLYPASMAAELSKATFAAPGPEFRGAPFWSWNCRLDRERLLRQIGWFSEMGMGGWHIHVRTGLDTPYLGEAFMDHVKACVDAGRTRGGMRTWLYDEDRWPSGYAGGLVTIEERFRHRCLRFSRQTHHGGCLLARYAVSLDGHGALEAYRRLPDGEQPLPGETLWNAEIIVDAPTSWFNGATYADTMNAEATRRFIAVTHQAYRDAIGPDFGGLVPAIFTDEPSFGHRGQLPSAQVESAVHIPWTNDFAETHLASFGSDPLDSLPELFWDLPDGNASPARWRYHEHSTERFTAAFADTLGEWCGRHGIALTGHFPEEDTLASQTACTGESMRGFRAFHIPGIDILSDAIHLSTAKQAQSAKHQYGREAMLSELYGVTDWDFTFAQHKRQGDWQAALGVTVRVHHLAWVSMLGEAKRDFPASISYQSPWFREYRLVEDHFARINTVLTRGLPRIRIALIHPVESLWLAYGPRCGPGRSVRDELEHAFQSLTRWLCHATLDFDYIAESLLPELCADGGFPLRVGAMAYDAVVVPPLTTLRATTFQRLESFAASGGTLIFFGKPPERVDCLASPELARLCAGRTIPATWLGLMAALEPFREVAVQDAAGAPAATVLSQLRVDGAGRHLFVCNTSVDVDLTGARIRLRGTWALRRMDTHTGDINELAAHHADGWTESVCDLPGGGHLLLSAIPATPAAAPPAQEDLTGWDLAATLDDHYPIERSEPNVLLLDQAEWRIDGGTWQPCEEMLRLDNLVRQALDCPPRKGDMAQPWSDTSPAPVLGEVSLRCHLNCEAHISSPRLALEQPEDVRMLLLDGAPVAIRDVGWWVDEDIRLIELPALTIGPHLLEIVRPYSRRSGLEWMHLLGAFGVRIEGRNAVVTEPPHQLAFGDWTRQSLPFYTGTITYHCTIDGGRRLRLALPQLAAPLAAVALDGRNIGHIWFAPWHLDLGHVPAGRHDLAITLFGNRRNAFGALHYTLPVSNWSGPSAWRSEGRAWSYAYHFRPTGQLAAPRLESAKTHLTTGWYLAPVPDHSGDVSRVPARSMTAGWVPLPVNGIFIKLNERCAPDGVVFLGRTLHASEAGACILDVGHDGGVRIFVDGLAVAAAPELVNPAPLSRTRVRLHLEAGDHELVVAFDRAGGKGWGFHATIEA